MRLCRFGAPGEEKPGIILENDGGRIDLSAFGEDFDESFFSSDGIARLARNVDACPRVSESTRIAAPIGRPSKIVCVGLNYSDHAAETNSELPKEPMLFSKATTAMCGARDAIIIPRDGTKTDWEVELAVVIGKRAQYVPLDDWKDYVAGYCVMNDVSERAFQKERGGQFIKGKSADTFAPFGPFLRTADEVTNPNSLQLRLSVNGEIRQQGSTEAMIFNVPFLVSYISQFMTLLPGDVISTGTPAGVGAGCKPPQFLNPGDILDYSVEGLGECRNEVVSFGA
jgi:2-keto-4-pentenoate hydratase/2-oxohepta-3-ene-1,7-dioic acid hydratase in catechol pathway